MAIFNPELHRDAPKGFTGTLHNELRMNPSQMISFYTPEGAPIEMYGAVCKFNATLTTRFKKNGPEKKAIPDAQNIRFEVTLEPSGNVAGSPAVSKVVLALAEKIKQTVNRRGFRLTVGSNDFKIDIPPSGDPLRFIANFYEVYIRETEKKYAQGKDPLGLEKKKSYGELSDESDPDYPIIRYSPRMLMPAPNLRQVRPARTDPKKHLARDVAAAAENFFPVGKPATRDKHRDFHKYLCDLEALAPTPQLDAIAGLALRWFPHEPKGDKTELAPVIGAQHQEFVRELHKLLRERGR